MSRPDLYDLAIDNGGLDLIPEDLCRQMHVGVKTAWAVFVHRLLYADSTGVMSWGTQSIADKLRIDRIRVRECDELLLAAGLMRVVGKRVRGRTTSYRMLPDVLDAIAEGHEQDDGQPETEPPDNAELARGVGTESWHGELARKVGTESVAKKRSEVKNNPPTPQKPEPSAQPKRGGFRPKKPEPEPAEVIAQLLPPRDERLDRRCRNLADDWNPKRTGVTAEHLYRLATETNPEDPHHAVTLMRHIGMQCDIAAPDVVNPLGLLKFRLRQETRKAEAS